MMGKAVVQRIGDDLCVELPPEIIGKLQLHDGDTLYWAVVDGAVLYSKVEPDPGLRIYARGTEKYRNALRELAD